MQGLGEQSLNQIEDPLLEFKEYSLIRGKGV